LFEHPVGVSDLWIVTHWTTAHAADVASRIGILDPRRIFYLVQDYEPGFTPWSTQHALASATYHAGFQFIVNSAPLAAYLESHESIEVSADQVFRPHLDLDRLEVAASKRRTDPTVRVMFYGRPSKPRNLFALGVSALRVAVSEFERQNIPFSVISAGEAHDSLPLSPSKSLLSLGTLGWSNYYKRLALIDVMVSLQYSPHPSHPPLDAISSGARAVTNEFGGDRASLSERLFAGPADPDSLGNLIVQAASDAKSHPESGFDASVVGRLGAPLPSVIEHALSEWDGR